MAFSSGGGGRKGMSDINVTPLVDVMLVLLIIFMVTAPLIQQGVKIALPSTKATQMDEKDQKALVVLVDASGKVFIGDVEVPVAELEERLKANKKVQEQKDVVLKADRTLPYGQVVEVMAKMQAAGIVNLGLATDPTGAAAPDKDHKPGGKR